MPHQYAPEPAILPQPYPPTVDARIFAFSKFTSQQGGPALMVSASAEGVIDKMPVSFAIPSHAAICLHLANQAHIKSASVNLGELVVKCPKSNQVASDKIGWLYNFFEQRFLNIVFSFTALEAFANQTVPDDFVFSKLRQDKKSTESFDKDQIERNLSLDIKLSEVLPKITGIKFEKGTSLWNQYSKLKAIRDRIVHIKSVDMGIKDRKITSVWAEILEGRNTDYSLVAHRVIQHFPVKHDKSSSPVAQGRDLWIQTFPFNRPKK